MKTIHNLEILFLVYLRSLCYTKRKINHVDISSCLTGNRIAVVLDYKIDIIYRYFIFMRSLRLWIYPHDIQYIEQQNVPLT